MRLHFPMFKQVGLNRYVVVHPGTTIATDAWSYNKDDDSGTHCGAEGFTVRAYAPVLAMCRKLIEAGYDPATPLHAM